MAGFIMLLIAFIGWFILGILKVISIALFWIIFIPLALWLIVWGYKLNKEKQDY